MALLNELNVRFVQLKGPMSSKITQIISDPRVRVASCCINMACFGALPSSSQDSCRPKGRSWMFVLLSLIPASKMVRLWRPSCMPRRFAQHERPLPCGSWAWQDGSQLWPDSFGFIGFIASFLSFHEVFILFSFMVCHDVPGSATVTLFVGAIPNSVVMPAPASRLLDGWSRLSPLGTPSPLCWRMAPLHGLKSCMTRIGVFQGGEWWRMVENGWWWIYKLWLTFHICCLFLSRKWRALQTVWCCFNLDVVCIVEIWTQDLSVTPGWNLGSPSIWRWQLKGSRSLGIECAANQRKPLQLCGHSAGWHSRNMGAFRRWRMLSKSFISNP